VVEVVRLRQPGPPFGDPLLRVLFARLPAIASLEKLPCLDADLAAADGAQHQSLVQAGWLPALRIGMVVRAGFVVGQLGSDVATFTFDRDSHEASIEYLRSRASISGDGRSATTVCRAPVGCPVS